MDECTEKTRQWPGEPDDVSPDELDAFLAHVEICPFHAEKMRSAEEELQSVFRLARGLDSHGRILLGKELKDAIAGQQRDQARWKKAMLERRLPFKRIYLSNCGEDIASSGKFYDFRRYEGDHPLNPKAGLQVWGVFEDEGKPVKIQLGFYPLLDVRHTGEEKFIPLDNGYIVGLKVMQRNEWLFNIEFRCVEYEVLAEEWAEAQAQDEKAAAAANGSSFSIRLSDRVRKSIAWLTPSRERLVPQMVIGFAAFLFIAATVKGMVLLSTNIDSTSESRIATTKPQEAGTTCSPSSLVTTLIEQTAPDEEKKVGNKDRDKGASPSTRPQAAARTRQIKVNPTRAGPDSELEAHKEAGKDHSSEKPVGLTAESDSTAQPSKTEAERQPVWRFRSLVNGRTNDTWLVVHTGKDDALKEKLIAEIHRSNFSAFNLDYSDTNSATSQPLTIAWDISRHEKFVTVQAVLKANGKSEIISVRTEGDCAEQACNQAVTIAVSGVFAVMQRMTVTETAASK